MTAEFLWLGASWPLIQAYGPIGILPGLIMILYFYHIFFLNEDNNHDDW